MALDHQVGNGDAKRLQVADGVGAAVVPGHDVVHLQDPLVLAPPQHSQRPRARVSTLYVTEPLIWLRWLGYSNNGDYRQER